MSKSGQLHHEPSAVKWAREKAGLTRTGLAERAGVTPSLIGKIEKGTRNAPPALLLRIASALNCPVVVLERKRLPGQDAFPAAASEVGSNGAAA